MVWISTLIESKPEEDLVSSQSPVPPRTPVIDPSQQRGRPAELLTGFYAITCTSNPWSGRRSMFPVMSGGAGDVFSENTSSFTQNNLLMRRRLSSPLLCWSYSCLLATSPTVIIVTLPSLFCAFSSCTAITVKSRSPLTSRTQYPGGGLRAPDGSQWNVHWFDSRSITQTHIGTTRWRGVY